MTILTFNRHATLGIYMIIMYLHRFPTQRGGIAQQKQVGQSPWQGTHGITPLVAKSYIRAPNPSHFSHSSQSKQENHSGQRQSEAFSQESLLGQRLGEGTQEKTLFPLERANWWTGGQQLGGEGEELHQVLQQAKFGSSKVIA